MPEAVKKILKPGMLDQPLYLQYLDYLSHLVKGDLGSSHSYRGQTVNDIIKARFPVSVELGLTAIILALLLGIPAGIMAALHQNKTIDRVVMFFSTIGIAVPSFVIDFIDVLPFLPLGAASLSYVGHAQTCDHACHRPGGAADGFYRSADPLEHA